jgi:2-haloacid dehalogenase
MSDGPEGAGEADHEGEAPTIRTVVFDLGGVLIDWNPRYLYRQLFDGDDDAMEAFLAEVTTQEWNAQQDAGRSWAEAVDELSRAHPDRRELIEAYWKRWPETLGGAIDEAVAVLGELKAAGVPVYALSNWSAETFPVALERFPFLDSFDGIVVSGDVGVTKPDERIFAHLLGRFELDPSTTLFIDDSETNVGAAKAAGLRAVRFVDPASLRQSLRASGLLDGARSGGRRSAR